MITKKTTFLYSVLISACLGLFLVGFSSPAWSAEEDDNIPFYDYAQRATELVMQAMSVVDARYRYGGSAPETGIDCSGLVRYVFKKAWGAELPRTATAISELGQNIETEELQPGDLVFYNTRKRKFSHVGIYLGDNQFVHAPSRGGKVRVENMAGQYWQVRFNGARRITDPQKEKVEIEHVIQTFRDDIKPKALVRSH
ncbi:MAG: C40 family peptidase [Betaproteobacteria bacterium]|nr:C40 family peptidase [Betaproteobacteria bacterium]